MKPLRRRYFVLFVICMLNVAGAQDGPRWIPFDPDRPEPSPPSATVDRGRIDPNIGMHIDFNIPGMYVEEVVVAARDNEVFHRLSIPMGGTLHTVALPEVPMVTKVLEVPMDTTINITVVSTIPEPLDESYNIYPAQPDRPRQDDPNEDEEEFVINEEAYRVDANYPRELVGINPEDDVIIRGHRIVFLRLYPVQYNPVTRMITSYSYVGLQLKYRPDPKDPNEPRIGSEPFGQLQSATVINDTKYAQIIEHENARFMNACGDETKSGCDYLILTPETFYNADDPSNPIVKLADWKRRKGYLTRVATLKNNVTSQHIKGYLQNAYDNWDPIPTYVLLVGDVADDAGNSLVPTNDGVINHNWYGRPVATDLYYTTLDGFDYHSDLLIGRLSVDTIQQAEVVIDKILSYEKNLPALPNFFLCTSLAALFEDRNSDGQEDGSFRIIEFAEEIWDFLKAKGYAPERIYDYSGHASGGPQKYEDGTEVPSYLKLYHWSGNTMDILTAVVCGRFLVVYDGHGNRTSWSQPRFDIADIEALKNGSQTPVVLSFACETGWYDNETDGMNSTSNMDECFCEHFLRHPEGGAVGIIGSSRISFADNDYLMKGMTSAIWPDFDPNLCNMPSLSDFMNVAPGRLGLINEAGKACMKAMYSSSRTQLHFEMYNLLGDPEMPIWTQEPEYLFESHMIGVVPGNIGVLVTDSSNDTVKDAVVVLMRGDNAFRKETDASGHAHFNLNETGTYEVTITAQNFWPYEGTIDVF